MRTLLAITLALAFLMLHQRAYATRDYSLDVRSIEVRGANGEIVRLETDGNGELLKSVTASLPFGDFKVLKDQLVHITHPDIGSTKVMLNPGGATVTVGDPDTLDSKEVTVDSWRRYYVVIVRFYDSDAYTTEGEAPELHVVFREDQDAEMYVVRNSPCPPDRKVACESDERRSIPGAKVGGTRPNNSFKPKPLRGSA